MMSSRGKSNKAERSFLEWATLFSAKLFVKLVIYADESGTHDNTGVQKGSREAIIAGIVAPIEDWAGFCRLWKLVLDKYGAQYFHFTEWRTASAVIRKTREPGSAFKNNPYRDWTEDKLDSFLIELATLVGSGNKLLVGGSVYTKVFNEEKLAGNLPDTADPYEHCADQFFASVIGTIMEQRAPWKRQPISFFFDQSDRRDWVNATMTMFQAHKKQRRTFREIAFADKKLAPHLPLQAADMVAYRLRQIGSFWVDEDYSKTWVKLDEVLFKSTFDFLDTHKAEIFRAYLRGELDHH